MSVQNYSNSLVGQEIKMNDDETIKVISVIIESGHITCVVGRSAKTQDIHFIDLNDRQYEWNIVNVRQGTN